jgi:hypothetical protein
MSSPTTPSPPAPPPRKSLSPAEVIHRAILLERCRRRAATPTPIVTPPPPPPPEEGEGPVTPRRQVMFQEPERPSSRRIVKAVMWETCNGGVVVEFEGGRVLKRGNGGGFLGAEFGETC